MPTDSRPTAIERAFQLARSGRFNSADEIDKTLYKEGYTLAQLTGPTLRKQLRGLIQSAKGKTMRPDASQPDCTESEGQCGSKGPIPEESQMQEMQRLLGRVPKAHSAEPKRKHATEEEKKAKALSRRENEGGARKPGASNDRTDNPISRKGDKGSGKAKG